MPSWNNSYSSEEMLGDITPMDYAPDTVDDPVFCGIAEDSSVVCRVHQLKPRKCVAFDESNTGRIFLLCPIGNQVENCGMVEWIDGEWPLTAQRAIDRLWSMYIESNTARVDEKLDNAKLLKDVTDEKNKIEHKYCMLTADVNKYMNVAERSILAENYAKIRKTGSLDVTSGESSVGEIQKERDALKIKVEELEKTVLDLKQEKEMLEQNLYKLVYAKDANKDKLKKIRELCDD